MTNIEQIKNYCSGSWLINANITANITYINIDTRNLDNPKLVLFVAIATKLRDGHSYFKDAYQKGVRNFLVTQNINVEAYPDCNIILVNNAITALQQISTKHRQLYYIPVIGITGSNGKTIVKEWLYQLLGADFNAVRSPKSYNSQIGVTLSVWQLN